MLDPYLSWLWPDVADQMKALADSIPPNKVMEHPPYFYFVEAMKWLLTETLAGEQDISFIDVGCGVGHYGELLACYYPYIKYRAFDFSQAMIDKAKAAYPDRQCAFWVADAKEFNYSTFDIVFASSLIEVMDQWDEGAEAICRTAKDIILLHRVRYGDKTERTQREGYKDQPAWMWIHNEEELLLFLLNRGFDCIYNRHWDTNYAMATYIFKRA